ncbi:tetratricopeptide repeat-containing sulfotransferase family protein [Alteromonas sp. ASW11-130]|uniref:tetratricopeptide repeat-containing sulfotransferase family protein n=1 Tax=Alteromonas sp. ASW11-130 TaxID=3015775 RepID=UPI0022419973|nr:tetratricopeptide repeat-containing sulfotransferase family protein [Alteromonas sp. ASW11-130]MCW8090879.1 sulfotransferase [Alteromonas sp. ASW11-130]
METRSQLFSKAEAACDAGDVINAQRTCSIYQRNFGEDANILYLSGRTHLNLQQHQKAVEALAQSYKQATNNLTLAYLIVAAAAAFNRTLVQQYASQLKLDQIDRAELLLELGHGFAAMHLDEHACTAFFQFSEKWPHHPEGYYHLGMLLMKQNKSERAAELFLKAIKSEPEHALAQHALSIVNPAHFDAINLSTLQSHLEYVQRKGAFETSTIIAHALSRIHAHQGCFSKAEDVLLNAKRPFISKAKKTEAKNAAIFDWLLEGKRESCSGSLGSASTQPIFVVGMPETGLDIVAQIISSHPDVASAFSANHFAQAVNQLCSGKNKKTLNIKAMLAAEQADNQQLGEHYLRLTGNLKADEHEYTLDVQPLNFLNVSLIKRALPNAKVIIMLREPIETVLLNYLRLQVPFNQSNGYRYDLLLSCRYYRHFYNLVLRWQSIFGESIRVQSYASLKSNFDKEVTALMDYCGLATDDRYADSSCVDFSAYTQMFAEEPLHQYSKFGEIIQANLGDLIDH